ncbi:MAG: hypothetical protein H8F28_15705 [Fibrella sp.]|nr:hypothetical protein [Armatimonadota bacterium]
MPLNPTAGDTFIFGERRLLSGFAINELRIIARAAAVSQVRERSTV